MYPAWPQLESLYYFRDQLIQYAHQPFTTKTLFSRIHRINQTIPIYSASVWGVPIFIKEDFTTLGRGLFENEVQVSARVNQLRRICPNFTVSYGQGRPPGKTKVLFNEYVEDATLIDVLREREKPSFLTMFSYFVQSEMAMEIARDKIGLVHNDLFASNIVGKLLPQKMTIRYGEYAVQADHFPIIFDFDRSYCDGLASNPKRDPRRDTYTLLTSFFYPYKSHFDKLLQWYNVTYKKGPLDRNEIEIQHLRLQNHSINELLEFGRREFGYYSITGNFPLLVPEPLIFSRQDT